MAIMIFSFIAEYLSGRTGRSNVLNQEDFYANQMKPAMSIKSHSSILVIKSLFSYRLVQKGCRHRRPWDQLRVLGFESNFGDCSFRKLILCCHVFSPSLENKFGSHLTDRAPRTWDNGRLLPCAPGRPLDIEARHKDASPSSSSRCAQSSLTIR